MALVSGGGAEVAVMLNGMGGTPLMGLYARVAEVLEREGVTLLKLDEEMKRRLAAPRDGAAGRPF